MKLMERKANRSPLLVEAGSAGAVLFSYIPNLLEIGKPIFRLFQQGAVTSAISIGPVQKFFWLLLIFACFQAQSVFAFNYGDRVQSTTAGLNIHSSATLSSGVIAQANLGDQGTVQGGPYYDGVSGWTFYYVAWDTHSAGYVVQNYLQLATVAKPNLQPQNVTLSSYSVQAGQSLTVYWTMANVGNGNCAASVTGLRLGTSSTSHPNTDPTLILSYPTPAISAHSSVAQSTTVTIPAGTAAGTYYVWVVADNVVNSTLGQTSTQDDYTVSPALAVTVVAAQPNLQPQSASLSTYTVQAGQSLTAYWTIANVGNGNCAASVTGLRLGTSSTSHPNTDPTLILSYPTPAISAHSSVAQSTTVTIPAGTAAGTYYVWVVADNVVNSTLGQTSTQDDYTVSPALAVTVVAAQPNLQPQSASLSTYTVQAGQSLTAYWTIANVGNGNCAASVTGLRLGTSSTSHPNTDPTLILSYPTPAISAHSSVAQSTTVTIPAGTAAGTYYVWVVADNVVNSTLGQTSTQDDYTVSPALAVTVVAAQPNLQPQSASLSTYTVQAGQSLTAYWTIANVGNGNCAASVTGLRLGTSSTSHPNTDPTLILSYPTPAISAHSSVAQSTTVTIPAGTAAGTYYVWVVADNVVNSTLGQTSTQDDYTVSPALAVTVVAAQPNLQPQSASLSTYTVQAGQSLTAYWTIANVGNGNCAASVTGLRLGTSSTSHPNTDPTLILSYPTPAISAHSSVAQSTTVTIPAGTAAGTYYVWVVADNVVNSTLGQTSTQDDYTVSPALAVTVASGTSLPIASPTSTTTWTAGTSQNITWTVSGPSSQISYYVLDYSLDGVTWTYDFLNAYPPSKSVSWTIPPNIASTHAIVRLKAFNSSAVQVAANVSPSFTISAPSVQNPVAVANCDNHAPMSGQSVNFSSNGSYDPAGGCTINVWSWNFGDGATSPSPNPSHVYNVAAGGSASFPVTLQVTDSCGHSGTSPFYVYVTGLALGNNNPTQPTSKDPVNLATGNYTYNHVDLQIPGRGLPFEFQRYYNSKATASTGLPLGYGWTDSYNIRPCRHHQQRRRHRLWRRPLGNVCHQRRGRLHQPAGHLQRPHH